MYGLPNNCLYMWRHICTVCPSGVASDKVVFYFCLSPVPYLIYFNVRSCGHGFESQTQQLWLTFFNLNLNCSLKRTKIHLTCFISSVPGLKVMTRSELGILIVVIWSDTRTVFVIVMSCDQCDQGRSYEENFLGKINPSLFQAFWLVVTVWVAN